MKIRTNELRRLIRESLLKESITPAKQMSDSFYDYCMSKFDLSDPTMAAAGRAAWEQQVARATDDFEYKVEALIDKLVAKLNDGQYYRGQS